MSWDLNIKRSVIYGMVNRVLYDMNHGIHNNGFDFKWVTDDGQPMAALYTKPDKTLDILGTITADDSALNCIKTSIMRQRPAAAYVTTTANLDKCLIDEYFERIVRELSEGGFARLSFEYNASKTLANIVIEINYGDGKSITFKGPDFKEVIDWVDEYFMVGA